MADENNGIQQGNQIAEFWHRLPNIARIGILLVVGALVVWLAWTGVTNVLRQWEPISTGIPDAERARVLEYLRSNNVEYRFEGDSIMVPADRAQELKIEMAGQDMQLGQLRGLERLETTQMGDTDKTIAAKRQLALQEEVQDALNSLSIVHSSNVKLALPEDGGFLGRTREPAKASVWLTLAAGARLTPEQVRGLQVQIAHSIQNLMPDDVSILDHNSNLLSQRTDGDTMLAQRKMEIEQSKREKILQLIDKKVGPGNALVAVTAVLNTVARHETRTEYDTERPAERSRRRRFCARDVLEQRLRTRRGEGVLPCGHFVQHGPGSVDVGPRVHRLLPCLLRRHVGRCPRQPQGQ